MVMQTAVIVLSQEAILICSIPPLLPHPPDFSDHNPTRITPFFTIPFKFPNDIVLRSELMRWKTFSSWYLESTPFYFNIFCQNFYMYSRFHIMLKPDLSSISLRVVKTPLNSVLVIFFLQDLPGYLWLLLVLRWSRSSGSISVWSIHEFKVHSFCHHVARRSASGYWKS